jgi:histidinol-phosphate aminotransferase
MPIQAPGYVSAIAPYQPGKPISEVARELGMDEASIIKLASNENPLGLPESAKAAMAREMSELGRYPDGNGFALKQTVSQRFGVPMEWITLGNGSNDILELVARSLLAPGDEAMYSQHSFAVYALATQAVGAKALVVPARELGHDLHAMAAAITPQTRLVFVANPNNPTGTFVSAPEVEAFLKRVPEHVAVVLDEAYNEYLPPELRFDSMQWVRAFPNLIVSRTLSKAYGLAGLRVGFSVSQPPITDLLNRVRQPFNVNTLAQAAAVAAITDDAFLERSYALNRSELSKMQAAFERMRLAYVPSYGNFVLVKVGNDDQAGMRVFQSLLKQGVIVRPVNNYGLPQWLRISVGLPEENDRFLKALELSLGAGA